MSVKSCVNVAAFVAVTGLAASTASATIIILTVPVGNAGNAPDSNGFGSVAYTYNIGRTEVTASQYAAFLNAVARSDPNQLYDTNKARLDLNGCGIVRSGLNGNYSYSVDPVNANRPVNYVTYWSAVRFVNWLHNGQPTGGQDANTTEDGAYTLTAAGIIANTITRNANWQWALPTEDEWYKAAYYQPASQGGDIDDYWLYPTASNTINPSMANYNGVVGTTTPAGSYAPNFYGTFDMGGNVWEWNDATLGTVIPGIGGFRGFRGGDFRGGEDDDGNPVDFANSLSVSSRQFSLGFSQGDTIGFRVVQVPSPGVASLLAIGGLVAARRRR